MWSFTNFLWKGKVAFTKDRYDLIKEYKRSENEWNTGGHIYLSLYIYFGILWYNSIDSKSYKNNKGPLEKRGIL